MIRQSGDHFAPGPEGFTGPNMYRIPPVDGATLARGLSVVKGTPGDLIMQAARTRQPTAIDAVVAIILASQRVTHRAAYTRVIMDANVTRWPILALGKAVEAARR